MQFSLIAHDYEDALDRHLACPEQHFLRLREITKTGCLVGKKPHVIEFN